MGVNIEATNVKIWRKDMQSSRGTFYRYSVSVSNKEEDGSWTNAYVNVLFSKKAGAPDKIANGALCDFTGFMSARGYRDRDGRERTEPIIIIMEADFKGDVSDPSEPVDSDSFEELDEDIPFK